MIVCPWCGTTYATFQSNCTNCGGTLQAFNETSSEVLPTTPLAPRPISNRYAWRLLFTDGLGIAALVFSLLGLIFGLVGASLTIAVVTAFVGIPFLTLGLVFLVAGGSLFLWRYQAARKIVDVLRIGESAQGQIVKVRENYSVTINGRHPWIIQYQFQTNGQIQKGELSSLNPPGPQLQAGKAVCILYLPSAPKWNSIYPHP
jgi:hypothetical protein